MAASGSGGNGPGGRPWTATSTWAPSPGGGAVEDAVSFETSDDDAEASPAAVVLSRPLPDGDGDAPPCEVTVTFRGKYEIHRVYVRSTARIYELYHSTDTKGTSKDYLCTVRCGLAVKEPRPCGEESMSQLNGSASTSDKREHETKSISSSSDEDNWVDVKIPESPMRSNTSESQERNAIRICQENTLAHYEATAEMTDVSPCVSLTIRLLSLQPNTSVHIEEIYIFADPVESTNDNSATGPGNMGGSSLLAMLVPGLMQMSKSRNLKIDDRYFSNGSRTQLTQDHAMKESTPCEKIMQESVLGSIDNYKPSGIKSGINPADSGTVSHEKSNHGEFQVQDPGSLPLPAQTTERPQVQSMKEQRVSNTVHLANPLVNENFTTYNHIERKLDTLLSKVEKMELYCSRFEDSMIKPLGSIEARLQRLEEQFSSCYVEIQSLRGSSAVRKAHSQEEASVDVNDRTPAFISDRKAGLTVRAPAFSSDDSCYNVTNENHVDYRGPNAVSRLLVKVPDSIVQPDLTGGNLHDGSSSPVYCAPSSEKERKTSPGLVVTVPEFPDDDDDDDDEVEEEEEKEAEVCDHDDGHMQYEDSLSKSNVDSTKTKEPVSINGALASALEALLISTKGTPSSKPVVCSASNLSPENTNDPLVCSLSPEKNGEMSTTDGSADQFLGTSTPGDANLVGTFIPSQETDATSHTSLSKEMLDSKVEINEQNNDLNPEKASFVASTESWDVPSQPDTIEESIDDGSWVNGQNSGPNLDTLPYAVSTGPLEPPEPPTVFEAVDNDDQVNENRPTISFAEFLAARNAFSGKNVISKVYCGNDGAEKLSFERALAGADKKPKYLSQFLVKKALEVAEEGRLFSSVPIGANFDQSSSAAPGNPASGHNIITKDAFSDMACGVKNTESGFRLSVGMDSIFSQYHATDSKKEWIESSSLDWSPDDSFSEPNVMHSWSNLSKMESFSGASAKEPVASANSTLGNYLEDLEDIGDHPTATQNSGEELQKVCDLLYEFKDDMLGMTFTAKDTSKSSPSLEVLLAESSDSEAQISDVEDTGNGAGIGSARMFSPFSSSDDDASAADEPLVDIADLTTPSEPYASAINEPLVDLADQTNSSGKYASAVNVVDLPNPSEACASDANDVPLVSVDGLAKPLETFSGGSSGEHPASLI